MTEITSEGCGAVPLPELPEFEHHWLPVDDITMHVATAARVTTFLADHPAEPLLKDRS